jgi:hypothetical protein
MAGPAGGEGVVWSPAEARDAAAVDVAPLGRPELAELALVAIPSHHVGPAALVGHALVGVGDQAGWVSKMSSRSERSPLW